MTLNRQIWYVLVAVVLISFFTSFIVTSLSATRFIEQQLTTENTNNANMLAQTLSNNSKEPALIELLISSQFDTGFYRSITLTDPQGELIIERSFNETEIKRVPSWFANWFKLDVPAGEALVQDGWSQFGTLKIQSQQSHALETLWSRAITLFFIALSAAILAGLLGRILLRNVTRPLNLVVEQAEAIGQGRYITNERIPKTNDLKQLVMAMNKMSVQIRQQFQKELRKLNTLQTDLYKDQPTGVYNRRFLMERLQTHSKQHVEHLPAVLVMLHLDDLIELNTEFGRQTVDSYIKKSAQALSAQAKLLEQEASCKTTVARMNASDFGLLIENITDIKQIEKTLNTVISQLQNDTENSLSNKARWYASADLSIAKEPIGRLLMRLDEKITYAKAMPPDSHPAIHFDDKVEIRPLFKNKQEWALTFKNALEQDKIRLSFRSTKDRDGNLIHLENQLSLEIDNKILNSYQFVPWAKRLSFISELELAAAEKAMQYSIEQNCAVAINLSIEFLQSVDARAQLMKAIQNYKKLQQPSNLWFELNEFEIHSHQELFSDFCFSIQKVGCYVGLQACTQIFDYMYDIETFGLNYLKIERSLTQALPNKEEDIEQSLPARLCQLGQSLNIKMYAEGVESEADIERIFAAGFDGYTTNI